MQAQDVIRFPNCSPGRSDCSFDELPEVEAVVLREALAKMQALNDLNESVGHKLEEVKPDQVSLPCSVVGQRHPPSDESRPASLSIFSRIFNATLSNSQPVQVRPEVKVSPIRSDIRDEEEPDVEAAELVQAQRCLQRAPAAMFAIPRKPVPQPTSESFGSIINKYCEFSSAEFPMRAQAPVSVSLNFEVTPPHFKLDPPPENRPNSLLAALLTPQVSLRSFNISHLIGHGGQGQVFLAKSRHLQSERLFAVKVIKKKEIDFQSYELIAMEQNIMLRFRDQPFMINLVASFHDSKSFFLVTDYYPGGDLLDALYAQGKFSVDTVRFFAAEIFSGINFLHKNGVIHRDIKPANILLSSTGHIVIADLGLASVKFETLWRQDGAEEGDVNNTRSWCGTPAYMAPEIWTRCWYSAPVDYWSLGIVIFQMLEGKFPFMHDDGKELENLIATAPLPWSGDIPNKDVVDLVDRLTSKDAEERIIAPDIMTHPFFALLDWEEVETGALPVPFIHKKKQRFFNTPMNLDDIEGTPCICDPHPYFYYADHELETAEPTPNMEPLSTLEPPSPVPPSLLTCPSPSPEPTPLHTPLMACLESFDKRYNLQVFEEKWDQLLQSSPDAPQSLLDNIPEQLVQTSKKILPDLTISVEVPPEDEMPSIPSALESFYDLYMSSPTPSVDSPAPSSIPFTSLIDTSPCLEPSSMPPQDSESIIGSSASPALPSVDMHSRPMELVSSGHPCGVGVKFSGLPPVFNTSYLVRLFRETKRLLTYILPTFVLHRL